MTDEKIATTRTSGHARSDCPLACTLDVVGDKWTLLVVRDLLRGKSRFNEFLASPEGVTTNILADRLKRMEAEGLIRRELYQERPARHAYQLTEKGLALVPVIQEICRWANRWDAETWKPPADFMAMKV
jgi:DNA-binding HxlR family transcriptional regulator